MTSWLAASVAGLDTDWDLKPEECTAASDAGLCTAAGGLKPEGCAAASLAGLCTASGGLKALGWLAASEA